MSCFTGNVPPVEGKAFRLHVIDQPHRVIGFAESFDDRISHCKIRIHLLPLFSDIRDEHIVHTAVGIR